ncbi:MAG: hypothetical protein M0C28_25715 [Candidatus Moduliflexus flocculans]|nr:hypothetical protein [Candidatus Moduliflexus flocculans]
MNLLTFLRNDFRLLWRHGFADRVPGGGLGLPRRSSPPSPGSGRMRSCRSWPGATRLSSASSSQGPACAWTLPRGPYRALFVSPLPPRTYFLVKAANPVDPVLRHGGGGLPVQPGLRVPSGAPCGLRSRRSARPPPCSEPPWR